MPYDDTLELKMKPEALQAFVEYRGMAPQDRGLRALAESWVATHGGKAESRRRQLDRWSAKYAWQELVHAWDKSKATEKATQFSSLGEVFDGQMVMAGEGVMALSMARLREMIEEDTRRHKSYLTILTAAAANPGTKAPARPRPQVGPMVLAQLLNWGAAEARQGHASRLERVGGKPDDFAGLGEEWPDVVEVSHSLQPPPEPPDPEEGLDEPDELGDAAQNDSGDEPDLPLAMVRLTTQRPRMSPDYDEEDED